MLRVERLALFVMFAVISLLTPQPLSAVFTFGPEDKAQLIPDFRLRFETDWDSVDVLDMPRDDRTRVRIRARIALQYDHSPALSFRIRQLLRTAAVPGRG